MQDAIARPTRPPPSLPETQQAVPFWKPMLLLAMVIAAGAVGLMLSLLGGLGLLVAAVLFHAFGGFNVSERLRGATHLRIFCFGFAWFCVTVMAVAAQFVFPAFEDVLRSFGNDLPLPTRLAMKGYPLLLPLPELVAAVWMFWPSKASSLRAATVFSCLCAGLILLAVGTQYLPIWQIGAAV